MSIEKAIQGYVNYRNSARKEKDAAQKKHFRNLANVLYNAAIELAVEEGKSKQRYGRAQRPSQNIFFSTVRNKENPAFIVNFDAEFVLPKVNWSLDREQEFRTRMYASDHSYDHFKRPFQKSFEKGVEQ